MPKPQPPYPAEYRESIPELAWAGRNPEELSEEFEPTARIIRCISESERTGSSTIPLAVLCAEPDQPDEAEGIMALRWIVTLVRAFSAHSHTGGGRAQYL